MSRLTVGPNDTVLSARRRASKCPDSTDSTGARFAHPVGYTLRARVLFTSSDSAKVDLHVSCSFTYFGRSHAFAQQNIWEVARSTKGWRVVRLLESSIT